MGQGNQIDLLNRIEDNQEGSGVVSFTTHAFSEKNLDELAYIAKMLEKVGVSLELTRNKNSAVDLEYDFMVLKLNKEKFNRVMTRQAGRKPNFNQKYDSYGKCTVAELKDKLKSMTKTKIAQELGCSRMTLYRILNNIERLEPAEDTSIWHYTS